MAELTKPPFRADHVGSLIRPDALIAARTAAEKGEIPPAELTRIQHDAIRAVVRLQEDIGLKLVTDGEYNRFSWQRDFLLKIGNVKPMPSRLTVRFHSAAGTRDHTPPSLQVAGKLSRPDGIFVDDFKFLKSVAAATPAATSRATSSPCASRSRARRTADASSTTSPSIHRRPPCVRTWEKGRRVAASMISRTHATGAT